MSILTSLLTELVGINSINPTLAGGPGEAEVARWIHAWLTSRNMECWLTEVAPGRPNIVARIPGDGSRPPLLLNAHLDTVGVEDMDAPFELRVEGDRLYGRGSYDMKGSVAIMLALADLFAEQPPGGDLLFTFVSDEEDLSVGTEALVRDWLPTLTMPPAAAIVLEPTEENIGIAHKGFAWFELTATGQASHGSRPDEGVDAIMPLGAALNDLAALEREFRVASRDSLLGRPSLHASVIEGGSAWSVYPAHATLRWERRTIPGDGETKLALELNRIMAAARAGTAATIEGRIVFVREPMGTPSDAPIVQAFVQAAPGSELVGLSFWTDGALFSKAGVPAVIYGPTGHGAHAVDEWVSAASLERCLSVVRTVIETGVSRG